MELHGERKAQSGKARADLSFIFDVLLLFRPGIIKSFKQSHSNPTDMFSNYFKIGFRILIRNKGYSFINVSGLAIGLAAAILILLWVQNEVSYDAFYPKTNRIFKLFSRDKNNGKTDVWGNTPALMAGELKQSYEEVEDAARYRKVFFLLKVGENHFNEGGAFADPGLLSMFSFSRLHGPADALENDFGIVLTKSMAIKLFGKPDCVGEAVIVNDTDNFKVTAVLENHPNNTEFDFEYLLPWNYVTRLGWDRNQTWAYTNATTFVLLKDGASPERFDSKINNIVKTHVGEKDGLTREVFAHPLAKTHLYSQAENGKLTRGKIETVRLFTVIAILIILIACINFMNLSTARSEKRAREVGVRKIVGAHRGSLIAQFISEGVAMVVIAFLFALVIVQLSASWFNQLVGAPIQINWSDPTLWIYSLALILATGLVAGSYPAFYLSSSKPLKVLKGSFKNPGAFLTPRKALVVLQFTFAIVLSICAVMVQQQIQFAQKRDAGYNRENVAYNFMQGKIPEHFEAIKNELISSGAAVSVTRTFSPVVRIWDGANGYSWPGSDESDKKSNFLIFGADADLISTFGMQLKAGREIDIKTHPSDTTAVVLNESAVAMMRLKDPVGETIKDYQGISWLVVGVIKDFIIESPYEPVSPMIINGWRDRYGVVNFRLNPANDKASNLAKVETIFKKYNSEYPFEYHFADEFYDRKFGTEKQTGKLALLFAGLTIFISCLGLFGLAAYMGETRTKEIGVRKILGASVSSITTLLSKDFIRLVIIAIVISSPLAWWIVSDWLKSFNYRVAISVWVFVNAGVISVLIALMTVSFQSIKAAIANPIKALRTE
jgi:ABC-type antimicrobial peptide transport system permease subunit